MSGKRANRPSGREAELTELWRTAKSAAEFITLLYHRDYVLLRCDCRKFWVFDDQDGRVHSLAIRLDSASAEDVAARLADARILRGAMYLGVRPCPRCPPPRYRYVTVRKPNESADAEDDPEDETEIPF
jgi:hypothetical protein